MRDLSKANLSKRKMTLSRKQAMILGGVFVVVVFAVLINNVFLGGGGLSSAGVTLRDAPTSLKPVGTSGAVEVPEGVSLKTENASMKDVKYGGSAKATVTRSYGGGTYALDVEATLPDPKNTYYQVWLVSGGTPVPVEYMSGSKTSWSLSLRDKDKFSKYNTVWITLERTKDSLPEERVMEGSF